MSHSIRKPRWRKCLVAALAAAATAVPAAQGSQAFERGYRAQGVAQARLAAPDVFERAVAAALAGASATQASNPARDDWFRAQGAAQTQAGVYPDDRAVLPGPSSSASAQTHLGIYPDDRPVIRVTEPTLVVATGGGFDWADAGIGAASGFGTALVLTGAALMILRRVMHRRVRVHRTGPAAAA